MLILSDVFLARRMSLTFHPAIRIMVANMKNTDSHNFVAAKARISL